MANMQPTPGYTPTWTGAMTNNQPVQPQITTNPTPVPQPQPQTQQPQNWSGVNQWPFPMPAPTPSVIMALVQSKAAVDNYPVGPNTTAFLMDYGNRVFWTKRQTPDGLGYDTVEHPFFTRDEYNALTKPSDSVSQNQNGETQALSDEVSKLREDLIKLRREFDDFMK